MSKVCINCGFNRPLSEYYRNPNTADKRVGVCKVCKRAYDRGRNSRGAEISRLLQQWRPA